MADALTDINYVTYGAGHTFGIDLNACCEEVHRSNMSKLGADGKPVKDARGKVLKGPDYSPPSLERVLAAQGGNISGEYRVARSEFPEAKPFRGLGC